jgi:hypothetical protein
MFDSCESSERSGSGLRSAVGVFLVAMGAIGIEWRKSGCAVRFPGRGSWWPVVYGWAGHRLLDRVGLECDRSGSGTMDAARAIWSRFYRSVHGNCGAVDRAGAEAAGVMPHSGLD